MPHLIIEHSADIKSSQISNLYTQIQNAMASITEGNFDPDQCKCRSFSFDEYLVGKVDHHKSSFIHITIKILAGRNVEVKKTLAQKTLEIAKKFFAEIATSPNEKDKILSAGSIVAEAISGVPHLEEIPHNSNFENKRCDLSVDIVDMERETYQKLRIG